MEKLFGARVGLVCGSGLDHLAPFFNANTPTPEGPFQARASKCKVDQKEGFTKRAPEAVASMCKCAF